MLWAPPVLPFAAGFVSECAAAYVPASCSPLIVFISCFLLPVPGVLPWHPPWHPATHLPSACGAAWALLRVSHLCALPS